MILNHDPIHFYPWQTKKPNEEEQKIGMTEEEVRALLEAIQLEKQSPDYSGNHPVNLPEKKEIQMTEEEIRTLLEKMDLEKQFPSFTELRKRVIETLPRLLDRPCPELIRLIPNFPLNMSMTSELEEVATRLINSGSIAVTPDGKRVHFPWHAAYLPMALGSATNTGEFDNLRGKVLEALPVLVGWLAAHQISMSVPTAPFSVEHADRLTPRFSFHLGDTGNLVNY